MKQARRKKRIELKFDDDGTRALQKEVDCAGAVHRDRSVPIAQFYEVELTAETLRRNGCQRVRQAALHC